MKKSNVFWSLILALSLINFGIDLAIVGSKGLSTEDLAISSGAWMITAGVSILVWMVFLFIQNGKSNGV